MEVDQRIKQGSLIIGNSRNHYGITREGTKWVVYKILREVVVGDYQAYDIVVGPPRFDTFLTFWSGELPSETEISGYARMNIYPVEAKCFNYIRDLDEYIITNRTLSKFLLKID